MPTITLDSLLERFDPPTFIKMDVEGAEVEVLEGAKRILSKARPTFYYEAWAATTDRCNQIFAAAGYKVTRGTEMNWLAEPQ